MHGSTFSPELDGPRLQSLLERVKLFMLRGEWRTLAEIQRACGGSEASCSARLRELRNDYKYTVERRRVGDPKAGLFAYRLTYSSDETGQLRLPGAA
jgi:hypothetical protein